MTGTHNLGTIVDIAVLGHLDAERLTEEYVNRRFEFIHLGVGGQLPWEEEVLELQQFFESLNNGLDDEFAFRHDSWRDARYQFVLLRF